MRQDEEMGEPTAAQPDVQPTQPTTGPVTDDEPEQASGGRARSIVAGVLGVLAILVLIVTTVAVWARATAFNSEKVAGIVGDAIAEPEVQAALADYVTEQVFTAVDVDAVLSSVLPDALTRLQPVIAAGAQTAVDRGLTRLLASPDVQALLEEVVERAHSRAMQLLEGDGLVDGITVVDGQVTVNLLPLIGRGIAQLQNLGLFSDLELPELTASGDPDEQIAELSSATGRDLPPDFGQLVVYESDRLADAQASLESAQRIVVLAKRAVWVLVGLTVVLIAATILVARRRWRATLLLGVGGAAAMILTRAAVRRVVDEAPELAVRPGGRAAIDAIVSGASTGLLRLAGLFLLLAIAATVLGLLRRHWRRADLVLVAAVALGAAVVVVLDISIVSILLGIVVGVAAVLLGRRYFVTGPAPPAPQPA
jgi:hypothetical protein